MATYSYNARNQIASTIIENGLFTATRSYDTAGRLTGISNGALDSTGYTLSPDGRRTGNLQNYLETAKITWHFDKKLVIKRCSLF